MHAACVVTRAQQQVQDGADLDTAYKWLREARDFFASVAALAQDRQQPRHALLQELRAF